MQKTSFEFDGINFTFHVANPDDFIQKTHLAGEIFDYLEIQEILKHVTNGAVIADIGANVGNHTVFLSKKLPNSTIIPFEPHPEALTILRANLGANGCSNVDQSHLGIGLSDTTQKATMQRGGKNNLGGSRIVPDFDQVNLTVAQKAIIHEINVVTGDSVLADKKLAFIKIDVEGLEMRVLSGLSKTIAASRPVIFIEVHNKNEADFKDWCAANRYAINWTDTHYPKVINYLLIPIA